MLSEQEITVLRGDLITFLNKHGICRAGQIVPGQPLALELWDGLFCLTQDLDADLPRLLDQGVPTGIVHTIPPSGVWREVEVAERPDLGLLVCDSPWGSGLDDPATVLDLVQADVDAGFAEWLPGGLPEAKARFGARCAAGRLGLVHKEGSPPRLIGDSTICNANLLSRVSEKIELPTLEDVAEFISRYPHDEWMALVLDVCKAHKRVKVHPSEQGFSIFTVVDADGNTRWLVYKTCHFGCAWAAFWWARVAAGLVSLTHRLIAVIRHFLAIYVDDNLSLLPMHSAPTLACLQIVLACVLGVPLSWHKL